MIFNSKRQLSAHVEIHAVFVMIVHSLSPSRCYLCSEGHPHLCTPKAPNQSKLSITRGNKMQSKRFFPFPATHSPLQSFQQSLLSPTSRQPQHDSLFQSHFFSFHTAAVTGTAQEDATGDRAHHKEHSLWSCFSNSAFSSGNFCKEFKASSSNLLLLPFDWPLIYSMHQHHTLD